jgi:hypothetical protein
MIDQLPRLLRIMVAVALVLAVLTPVAVLAAGGTFTDDDTSVFEADIEWLAGAGVTLGCNPPANDNFCPDQPVRRGQMAAFMHRLAVNQVVDAATAAQAENADLLDGSPISHYNNPIWGNEPGGAQSTPIDGTSRTWAEYTIPTITGGLVINASAAIQDTNTTALALFWVQVDNTTCNAIPANIESVAYGYASIDTAPGLQSMSLTGVALVLDGNHTLTLCGREFGGGGGDTIVHSPSLTAVFSVSGDYFSPAVAPADNTPIPGTIED